MRDESNHTTSTVLYWPTGAATLSEVQLFATGFLQALDAVTGAVIESASVSFGLTLPGPLKSDPVAGHYNGNGANFTFALDGSDYTHSIRVPAVLESLIVPGSDAVDTADAAITALVTDIVDGVDPVYPSNQFGIDITALLGANRTFRRS